MRLLTNVLLISALLATRVVPLGHSHEVGIPPVDHDARPHVHIHGHDHAHDHHVHDHAQEHEDAALVVTSGSYPTDHDDDALYVEMLSPTAGNADGRGVPVVVPECIELAVQRHASIALPSPEAVAEPPPRIRLDGPPLYLRNLSLRI